MSIRLNKLLAQRGVGARRKCDTLIQSGAVRVNGIVEKEPGTQVEPERDRIEVDGRPIPGVSRLAYYVLHKPVGVISTLDDPEGRRTLREFMPAGARLFPVGRLDADTSGLLILTNDGELAHHLMHPRYGVSKFYRAHADRAPSPAMVKRLESGIEFEPGVVSSPARVRVRDETPGDSVIEIALREGRHRQVRLMCEAAGLLVHRLHRWGYGPLRLGDLARGMWRELSESEVLALRSASARPQQRRPGRTSGAVSRRAAAGAGRKNAAWAASRVGGDAMRKPGAAPRPRAARPPAHDAVPRPRAARPPVHDAAPRERAARPRAPQRPERRERFERPGATPRPRAPQRPKGRERYERPIPAARGPRRSDWRERFAEANAKPRPRAARPPVRNDRSGPGPRPARASGGDSPRAGARGQTPRSGGAPRAFRDQRRPPARTGARPVRRGRP